MMYNRKYTPEKITHLEENEIFVFGSNLAGAHGGGAACMAFLCFGAKWGSGVGLQGQSYAIPTMQGGVETIKPYVDEFIRFAREHEELTFLVTRIGCGIAGFRDEEMAPLFEKTLPMENVLLPKEFVEALRSLVESKYNFGRFLLAHKFNYARALQELGEGKKQTHWIWFIFPHLAALGRSANGRYYGISGREEAEAYLRHSVLGARLREVSKALLAHDGLSAVDILGEVDAVKVCACMTLFDAVSPRDIFREVLDAFYNGETDGRTLELVSHI